MKNIKQVIKKRIVNSDFISQKIINGETIYENDQLKKYDFFCSLVYKGSNSPFCGGNYIGNKIVLTAAHCVDQLNGNVNDLNIIFNKTNAFSSGDRFTVRKILIHPNYSQETSDNDIALIYLDEEPDVSPIYLPTPLLIKKNIYSKKKDDCIIIGYGKTEMSSGLSLYLKKALINIMHVDETDYPEKYITENMIIAGDNNDPNILDDNEDSCQGDSGGPLFKEYVYNDMSYLILLGLTSWGYGCGVENYGGIYTKCSNYIQWVKENWFE